MQYEQASRRARRLALLLAPLVALAMLLSAAVADARGATGGRGLPGTGGPSADSSGVLLALRAGYRQAGGSPAVRTLQRRLTRLGYAPGPVDGLFGPRTQAAVLAFQTRHHLTADGVVGPDTHRRLHALRTTVSRGVGLDRPDGAPRVRTLQRRLTHLGYQPGPVDGRFGPHTETAVIAFQRDHGLADDGIAGPNTYARLRTAQPPSQTQTPTEPQPQAGPAPTHPSTPTQTAPPTPTTPTSPTTPSETPTAPSTQTPPQTQSTPPAQTPHQTAPSPAAPTQTQNIPSTPPATTTQATPPAQTPAPSGGQTPNPAPPAPGGRVRVHTVPADAANNSVPSLAAVVVMTLAALALAVVVIAVLPFLLVSGVGRRRRVRRRQHRAVASAVAPDWLSARRAPPVSGDARPTVGATNGQGGEE
jgi:peptidoglycan hydrolase-like protein with peptidoglycan-binding domain